MSDEQKGVPRLKLGTEMSIHVHMLFPLSIYCSVVAELYSRWMDVMVCTSNGGRNGKKFGSLQETKYKVP